MSVTVEFGGEAVEYSIELLRSGVVANDIVAGLEIAAVVDPADDQRWAVFSRRLDGEQIVELEIVDGMPRDVTTGTTFDANSGRGVAGPLSDQTLDLLPGFTSFPWEFAQLWPDGRTWSP
jgi:hypothetical protein